MNSLRASHSKSFDEILRANKGMGPGFDLLRLSLATLILLSHTSSITGASGTMNAVLGSIFHVDAHIVGQVADANQGGLTLDGMAERPLTGLGRPITLSYLPMFFALSGFLVTGSAIRARTLLPFLGLRVLRLLPALFVEVTLSAILIGGLFTTLPVGEYYHSSGFWSYFYNIIGDVHLFLPGVFEGTSHTNAVNANLWTLPWEMYCYVVMSGVIITSLIFRRNVATVIYLVLTIAALIMSFGYDYQVVPAKLHGPALVFYFLTGTIFYLWREKIIFSIPLVVVVTLVAYGLMLSPRSVFVTPVLLTYIIMFIGLFPFPQFRLLRSGDYSYGVYLYGMPVTQALVAAFPMLKSNLPLALILSVTATMIFAVFSWHAVEKHCLKLKRYISPKSSQITAALHPGAAAEPPLRSAEVRPMQVGAGLGKA